MYGRTIENHLENWMQKKKRKPLVIRGARQVGKTSIIRKFGSNKFKYFVELNLEKQYHKELFSTLINIKDLIIAIEITMKTKIIPSETLLFIDEIQQSSIAMQQLRYFHEEEGELHVIAAGSLLEVKIINEGFSFPVGRVEYCYMYPLSFEEFLKATYNEQTFIALNEVPISIPISEPLHKIYLKHFNNYMTYGGMPEVVKALRNNERLEDILLIYESLMTSFIDDISKYSSVAKTKYIEHILENAPLEAGKQIVFEHFGGGSYRSREMKEAFMILQKAMIFFLVQATNSISSPLLPKGHKSPKLLFLDAGLSNFKMNIIETLVKKRALNHKMDDIYNGMIAEQIVGQTLQLLGKGNKNFFYWYRNKKGSLAEVDYIIQVEDTLIPIEVKSGKAGRLRSLDEFMLASDNKIAIRIYTGNIQIDDKKTFRGSKQYKLVSIPFYLAHRVKDIAKSLNK